MWTCPCGASYSESDADFIVRHVAQCDYCDGAGQPVLLTVEWSQVHRYIAEVSSEDLTRVTRGAPFADILGAVEPRYDEETEQDVPDLLGEFLTGLAEETGTAEVDGVDLTAVYPASRDKLR